MEDEAQARAYAEVDFAEPHAMFVRLWEESRGGNDVTGKVVDLGCGPADITVRIAERYPDVVIDAIDGSDAMLTYARQRLQRHGLAARIRLISGRLPQVALPFDRYDAIISNSLLHHLADPAVLWQTIRACGRSGTSVMVMDLMRPGSEAEARALVECHAADAPAVLRRDFHLSLRAAYRPDEVRAQLDAAGLDEFAVRVVSDRHLVVTGSLRLRKKRKRRPLPKRSPAAAFRPLSHD